jgi:hypothetical protein
MWMYLLPGPKKQERGTRFDKKGKKCEKKTSRERTSVEDDQRGRQHLVTDGV